MTDFSQLLHYASLAPSAHNTQPWKCETNDTVIKVLRDPAHTLQVGDPTLRETTLSIGAFIENLVIAAEHAGLKSTIANEAFLSSQLTMAEITLSPGSASTSSPLFDAITKRHTNRGLYEPAPLEASLLESLSLEEEGIKAFVITEAEAKARIAALVGRGVKIALSMRPMKEELAELVSTSSENRDTGMTVEAMLEHAQDISDGKDWVLNKMDVAADSQSSQERFATAPALVVIGSQYDGPLAWLKAGRLMERILLTATSHGLNHDISAAPVEVPTLAPLLRKEIDQTYRPQVLIRLGKPLNPDFTKPSLRRTL